MDRQSVVPPPGSDPRASYLSPEKDYTHVLWSDMRKLDRCPQQKDEFMCPVTGKLMQMPTLLRCLHTVDQTSLPLIATEDQRAYICPVCGVVSPEGTTKLNRTLQKLHDLLYKTPEAEAKEAADKVKTTKGGGVLRLPPSKGEITEVLKKIREETKECVYHPGQHLSLFDLQTQTAACPFCLIMGPSKNHPCVMMGDIDSRIRVGLSEVIEKAKETEKIFEESHTQALKTIDRISKSVVDTRKKIEDEFERMALALEDRKQQLLSQLDSIERLSRDRVNEKITEIVSHLYEISDSWTNAQKLLHRSSIYDLFDLKANLESRLNEVSSLPVPIPATEEIPVRTSVGRELEKQMESIGEIESETAYDVFDPRNPQCIGALVGHRGWVWPIVSCGSHTIVTGSSDYTLKLWNSITFENTVTMSGHSDARWDVETQVCLATIQAHEGEVWTLIRWGDVIISGGNDCKIKFWDRNLRELAYLTSHSGRVLSLAFDHRYIYSGSSDSTIRMWDQLDLNFTTVQDFEDKNMTSLVHSQYFVNHDGEVYSLCVAYGKLFGGSSSGTIKVWSTFDFKMLDTIHAHDDPVRALCPSADSVISGCLDGTVRIWNKHTHELLADFEAHNSYLYSLFVHDSRLYSSSEDGTVKIWEST